VRRITGVLRCAVAVATLSLVVGALPVHAASSVAIDARALVGGRYQIGGWMAVSVSLSNPGAATDGYLTARTAAGLARRYVELPAGARKAVTLYVEPDAFQREIEVTYTEPGGEAKAKVEIRVIEQSQGQVAIVGDAAGNLRPQLIASDGESRPDPIALAPADIPERPEPLDGLNAIVWAADSSTLTDGQRASLERWITDGGTIVVLGGPDWQARTAAFTELLPLTNLGAVDGLALASLADLAGASRDGLGSATVSAGKLRDDAVAVTTADDGTILASLRGFGAGQVIFVGADLATPAFRGWESAPRIWNRLVPADSGLSQFFGAPVIPDQTRSAMTSALSTLPSLKLPPAEVLLAVIVGYILLIGPVSYVVLRRMDRREMAWVTAPILIVIFSATSFGIGRSIKGSDVIVNQVSMVRTSGTGAALAETYFGIFSPDRSTYAVSIDADALLTTLSTSPEFDPGLPRATDGSTVVDQGRPARLSDLAVGAFGFAGVEASALVEVTPALDVTWSVRDGEIIGVVTNTSTEPISDVAYISGAGGKRIGDLAAGASQEFTLPGSNFNGSSASDQVYGFGGFETATDEQRRISQRRQVIDALVGYGGWSGMDVIPGGGAGPYVIGWREAEGPLALTIEGAVTQAYTSTVEVVTVRPGLGRGEITIQPHQMSTSLISAKGDVSAFDPGSVLVGEGVATFAIALPLEAINLKPDRATIFVGMDASVMMPGNAGFGGGMWPPGYTLEVRNPVSGEWTLLGDLSGASVFDVEPAETIGPSGMIEVRVTGVGPDPNQGGQASVFVTAEVHGTLDR